VQTTPTLRGRHVVLEPLKVEHADALWPAASDRELWRYMTFDVASVADLRTWIGKRLEAVSAGTALAFLQRDARTGEAFGSTSVFDVSPNRTMEVGHTWLGPGHRRTAANTEAKLLVLGHCFSAMGAIRIQLKCDERNVRSRAAIERLGAKYEGTIRNQMVLPDGHKRQATVYSILDSEWPAVKAGLEAKLAARK
jgi:RimJ/RimL family protein N-acetyltransferase